MERVFLSYSFDPGDLATRQALGHVETILRSHSLRLEDGAALGGGPLTPEIQERIRDCDGLVAILTPRGGAGPDGLSETSEWVSKELDYARAISRPCVAVVFRSVRIQGGMYADYERVDYDPGSPLAAALKLTSIVGVWKQRYGRSLKVRVEPAETVRSVLKAGEAAQCHVRLTFDDGTATPWQQVRLSRQQGGAFVTVPGVKDNSMIQMRVFVNGEEWQSVEAGQWAQLLLEKQA